MNIYKELSSFSEDMIELGLPILDNRIELFENKINFKLPTDFKFFLKKYNGLSLNGNIIYGLDSVYKESSLDKVYDFEHYKAANKMYSNFLPFSPDGMGNHYCLDLARIVTDKNNSVCPIVFWQFDLEYDSINEVEVCNSTFNDWVKEVLIEWTLENYNYDGTEK